MRTPFPNPRPSPGSAPLLRGRAAARGEIVVLPETVHTAALAAAALGCEVGAIANSLLFDADGSPVLVLTSGAHRVDTARSPPPSGSRRCAGPRRSSSGEHTGQVIGGVSPLGHPAPVPTCIDPWLRRHDVVWAAAGHPAAVFSTTYDELVAMTGAVETAVE